MEICFVYPLMGKIGGALKAVAINDLYGDAACFVY